MRWDLSYVGQIQVTHDADRVGRSITLPVQTSSKSILLVNSKTPRKGDLASDVRPKRLRPLCEALYHGTVRPRRQVITPTSDAAVTVMK